MIIDYICIFFYRSAIFSITSFGIGITFFPSTFKAGISSLYTFFFFLPHSCLVCGRTFFWPGLLLHVLCLWGFFFPTRLTFIELKLVIIIIVYYYFIVLFIHHLFIYYQAICIRNFIIHTRLLTRMYQVFLTCIITITRNGHTYFLYLPFPCKTHNSHFIISTNAYVTPGRRC